MKRLMLATALMLGPVLPLYPGVAFANPQVADAGNADEVGNDAMVALYARGAIGKEVWVVDSRPTPKYLSGYIPGAFGLPLDVWKKDPAALERFGVPKNGEVIFYCSGRECTLSVDSAALARERGWRHAKVYRNGVPGWNQKMQPLRAAAAHLLKGNLILLDPEPDQPSVVSGNNVTVPMSLAELQTTAGRALFESLSRNAPIVVLQRGDMAQVNAALEELRDMDFRRLAYFAVADWQAALASAPRPQQLAWAPVYGPGQVSPREFQTAVARKEFLLDVRPAVDYNAGHFPGAVNLPIEDMERDFAQVPKDRPVYVSCATGAKSQKAYDILGRKGYGNVRYLDAEVSCKGEACTIKE